MTPEFRVWDKQTKEYFHISNLWSSGANEDSFTFDGWKDNYGSTGFIDKITLEQYTGLKDKNGNKIFEGDIVHGYDQEPDREDGYIGSSVVEVVNFVDGAFWLGNIKYQIMLCTPPIIEVIGNIHENPELLEVEE
jgi:phage uncharacterized protein TIGR01671